MKAAENRTKGGVCCLGAEGECVVKLECSTMTLFFLISGIDLISTVSVRVRV